MTLGVIWLNVIKPISRTENVELIVKNTVIDSMIWQIKKKKMLTMINRHFS